MFPRAKGKIWLRVENLADRFDLINHFEVTGSAEVRRVNLEALAFNLFLRANPGAARPLIDIEELTLSGGKANEFNASKQAGSAIEGVQANEPHNTPEDLAGFKGAAFDGQGIRMFEVTYSLAPPAAPASPEPNLATKPSLQQRVKSALTSQQTSGDISIGQQAAVDQQDDGSTADPAGFNL